MLKKISVLLIIAATFAACGTNKKSPAAAAAPAAAPKQFGAPITADKAISYDALLTKMSAVDSMPAKVNAKVNSVCQVKGCWMVVQSDKPGQPEMRIKFKDYGFFVPKDLSGKNVIVDGYAVVKTTPVDVLRHYAEDAGKTPAEIAAITQPKRELSFMASGVIVVN